MGRCKISKKVVSLKWSGGNGKNMYNVGIGTGKKNIETITIENKCTYRLEDLYNNVVKFLEPLFYNYSTGNLDDVVSVLTQNYYEELAILLSNEKETSYEYTYYEKIRFILTRALEGLQKSVHKDIKNKNIEKELKNCLERCKILDDFDLLSEYVDEFNKKNNFTIFENVVINTPSVSLKPRYLLYIKRYGFPECGIWEADKIAAIRLELGVNDTD